MLVGGGMTQAYYWFRRNQAQRQPAVLLEQVAGDAQASQDRCQPASWLRPVIRPWLPDWPPRIS